MSLRTNPIIILWQKYRMFHVKHFSLENIPPVENVPQEHFQGCNTAGGKQGGAVLFAPPSKSYRFSHPPSTCARKHGHGDFAVCGRRLRGHVPSKNTSPTTLSWISLIWDSFFQSFCFRTMIFVFGASDIDTTIFFPVPYFHRFFHGKSIAIFPKACYTILNFKRALFGTGTEVFYEALRGHLALGTGACRGAGR